MGTWKRIFPSDFENALPITHHQVDRWKDCIVMVELTEVTLGYINTAS
jgi:hypothetical protein